MWSIEDWEQTMSDTPRTDAEELDTGYGAGYGFVPASFARRLERELAKKSEKLEWLERRNLAAWGEADRWVKLDDGYWGYRITEEEFQKMPK